MIRRALLASLCLLVACGSTESGPAQPPVRERGLEPQPDSTAEAPIVLVGVVHEGGSQACDASGEETWFDRTWAVGFTPIVHDDAVGQTLASLEGRVVMVEGTRTTQRPSTHGDDVPPAQPQICPMLQMRSDWELWPRGFRSRRGDEPDVGTVRARSVAAISVVRAEARGDDVVLGVTNPFDAPLRDAVLVAHYEGCYGKPGTTSERRPLGSIEPGAAVNDIAVPRIELAPGARGRNHRLSAVRLRATVEGGALDLDVSVATLGMPVECPDRG